MDVEIFDKDQEELARLGFWADCSLWPNEFGSGVFLANALNEMGTFLYGERWTGREFQFHKLDPLPDFRKKPTPLSISKWHAIFATCWSRPGNRLG